MTIICIAVKPDIFSWCPWQVNLWDLRVPEKLHSTVITTSLSDEEREDLDWYWTRYVLEDPFSETRADTTARLLSRCGDRLWSDIVNAMQHLLPDQAGQSLEQNIRLHVVADGSVTSLHSLPWETLEDEYRPLPNGSKAKVMVSRGTSTSNPCTVEQVRSPKISNHGLRILFVAARPSRESDINYRAVSHDLWSLRQALPDRIEIHFVRPGTWGSLAAKIRKYDHGYFDLVHLDLHGLLRLRRCPRRVYLEFASSVGGGCPSSSLRGADKVAMLMKEHGVTNLVLNACYSACAAFDAETNFAAELMRCGMENAVAMASKVSQQTVTLFMKQFYSTLAATRDWNLSVSIGRLRLATERGRNARFGQIIDCRDACVPVLYSNVSPDGRSGLKDRPGGLMSTVRTRATELTKTPTTLSNDGNQNSNSYSLEVSRCRDLDILSLEEHLESRPVLIVSGEAGSGKTTLARYLTTWWVETGYAEHVQYFEATTYSDNLYGDYALTTIAEIERLQADTAWNGYLRKPSNFSKVYIADGFVIPRAWDGYEASVTSGNRHRLWQLINICKTNSSCRLILFTSADSDLVFKDLPRVPCYSLTIPDAGEIGEMMVHNLQAHPTWDKAPRQDHVDMEEILGRAGRNVAYSEQILTCMASSNISVSKLLADLSDPTGRETWCDGRWPKELQESTAEPAAFFTGLRLSLRRLLVNHEPAYWTIMSLVVFQVSMPSNYLLWMMLLSQTGFLDQGGTIGKVFEARSSDLFLPTQEDYLLAKSAYGEFWDNISLILCGLGVARKQSSLSNRPQDSPLLKLHPLLPYALRAEIRNQRLHTPALVFQKLQRILWVFYEIEATIVSEELMKPGSVSNVQFRMETEEDNILRASESGLIQPEFSYRVMMLEALFQNLNYPNLSRLRLRKWKSLLATIVSRYERIPEENLDWFDLNVSHRRRCFAQAMILATLHVRYLDALHQKLEACKAVQQGLDLALSLGFPHNDSNFAAIWTLPLRAFLLESNRSSEGLALIADLLSRNFDYAVDGGLGSDAAFLPMSFVQSGKSRLAMAACYFRSEIPDDHRLLGVLDVYGDEVRTHLESIRVFHSHYPLQNNSAIQLGIQMFNSKQRGLESDQAAYLSFTEDLTKASNLEPLSQMQNIVTALRIQKYKGLMDSGDAALAKSGLGKTYENALRIQDLAVQAKVLDQLLTIAFREYDFRQAESLCTRLDAAQKSLQDEKPATWKAHAIDRARRKLLLCLLLCEPAYRFPNEGKKEDLLIAVAYARESEDVLSYFQDPDAQKYLVWSLSLLCVMGIKVLYSEAWSAALDDGILSLKSTLSSMFRAMRFALNGHHYNNHLLTGNATSFYTSVLYYLWRNTLNEPAINCFKGGFWLQSKLGISANTSWLEAIRAKTWEREISRCLNWEPYQVRRFMREIDKSLKDVTNPEIIDSEQQTFLHEANLIMLGPEAELGSLTCWRRGQDGLWRNKAKAKGWTSFVHSGVKGRGLLWCLSWIFVRLATLK